jgi:hypothetical protein
MSSRLRLNIGHVHGARYTPAHTWEFGYSKGPRSWLLSASFRPD